MRNILLTLLLMFGCLSSSIFFVDATESIEEQPIVSTQVPEQTEQPLEIGVFEHEENESNEEGLEEIDEFVMPTNLYTVDSFVDEHGIEWNRMEESEQIFASLKLMDFGISTQIAVNGTRVAKYYSPKFGYLTKFDGKRQK